MGWSERAPVYQRAGNAAPREPRTPAEPELSPEMMAWLRELLTDCRKSPRVTGWTADFVGDIRLRFDRFGSRLRLSPKQMSLLQKIEEKIHAAG